MKKWDGKLGEYTYIDAKKSNLMIDDKGNIYYNEGQNLWCSASRLKSHLQRLWQICGENAVTNEKLRLN